MNRVRRFFNGPAFLALVAAAVFSALLLGFITPNEQREAFLHSRAGETTVTATGAGAAVIFIAYLLLLPRGAIIRFVKSEGFIGLLAIVFTILLTYLFITA